MNRPKTGNPNKAAPVLELSTIKKALTDKSEALAEIFKKRFRGSKSWKLFKVDHKVAEVDDPVNLVFSHGPDQDKYLLIDISIPHLGIGQKFSLDKKARSFQKEMSLGALKVKKAILIIRVGSETVATSASRLKCPIIEIELSDYMTIPVPVAPRQPKSAGRSPEKNTARVEQPRKDPPNPLPAAALTIFSPDLLEALKSAIVHESLSTMHKRKNKYIRKGLWKWIEREILDPNAHFFLIILTSIYQGKTGELLSKKFKTAADFTQNADSVIDSIFSSEAGLASEIISNDSRHKKSLKRFLDCFAQTPPFDYLRTLFLKEFRTTRDGLKARLAVFTTLNQLLARCGFQGEKETQYPLEILDELGVFQGLIAGDYSRLRVENANKKLSHLVPEIDWSPENIYKLRDELSRILGIPSVEFNLNAYLPQAFVTDARQIAAQKREQTSKDRLAHHQSQPEKPPIPVERKPADNPQSRPAQPQQAAPSQRQTRPRVQSEHSNHPSGPAHRPATGQEQPRQPRQEQPSNRHHQAVNHAAPVLPAQSVRERTPQPHLPTANNPAELDESRHRFFENFGGNLQEDTEAVHLGIELMKATLVPEAEIQGRNNEEDLEAFPDMPPPKKKSIRASSGISDSPPPQRENGENPANGQPRHATRRNKQKYRKSGRSRSRQPGNNSINPTHF